MKTSYTPGPWRQSPSKHSVVKNGFCIAETDPSNCSLISAAPELLDALEICLEELNEKLDMLTGAKSHENYSAVLEMRRNGIFKKYFDVINKARGI